jgi:hypothetical protein
MAKTLTADDARESLTGHVALKGEEIRAKYGPHVGWNEVQRILQDRACVRYPVEVIFDAQGLLEGEMAFPSPKGSRLEDGFTLHVHPFFATQPDRLPFLVLYQLVVINYGEFASPDDAETFGAAVLGLSKDEYYQALCDMADQLTAGSFNL